MAGNNVPSQPRAPQRATISAVQRPAPLAPRGAAPRAAVPRGNGPPAPPARRPAASAASTGAGRESMAMCLALAVVLIVIKARLLPCDAATVGEFVRWLARLAVVSADDMLLVGMLAVGCRLVTA